MDFENRTPLDPVSIAVYLDNDAEPIGRYKPPAQCRIDTSQLRDGDHILHIHAADAMGTVGVRDIPFVVTNGPGITVTGLRAGSSVRGVVDLNINAFGADEPFDPVRAESAGPVPVWTWVFFAVIVGWAAWYGLEYFRTPEAFAQTPTYASNPALAAANAPGTALAPSAEAAVGPNRATGSKNVAGFDYASHGATVYAQSCQACHGAAGAGVPGAFPSLVGDPVVNGRDAGDHIRIVLHGLSGKSIDGTKYSSQMPAFGSQLNDADIAAVIDHERTSWGNHGPLVTPEEVTKSR
ncbi:MAG: cytochrome c [Candidatus Eremiobacteraeota bacterium]|nr:cytochrome c [Candidatus Eremiobacteraeota bacterium]